MVAIKKPRWRSLGNPYTRSVANTQRVKFVYSEFFTINAGLASTGTYVFSANGLFDPNISGFGHQPAGFDQLMAIYSEYVVLASEIVVTARNTGTSGGASNFPGLFGIFVERNTTTVTDWRRYVENGNGVYTHVESVGDGGPTLKVLKFSCDLNKEAGHPVLDDEGFSGTAGNNPVEQRYYHIAIHPIDNSSDMGAWQFHAEIRFDVILRDRILTDLS